MRHRVLQCASMFLVLASGVRGETNANLDMATPAVKAIAREDVARHCGPKARVGCTTFRDFMLTCRCNQTEAGWNVDAIASAVPQIYLSSFNYLSHEMLHITDFRHMLTEHLKSIEAYMFPSKASCERYATTMMNVFPQTMRRIARVSTAMRDGRASDTSEDHLIVVKAEVVPKLVDDSVSDLTDGIAPAAGDPQDRTAEDGDLVRQ